MLAFVFEPNEGALCVCGKRHDRLDTAVRCARAIPDGLGRIGVFTRIDELRNEFTPTEIETFALLGASDLLADMRRWPRPRLPRSEQLAYGPRAAVVPRIAHDPERARATWAKNKEKYQENQRNARREKRRLARIERAKTAPSAKELRKLERVRRRAAKERARIKRAERRAQQRIERAKHKELERAEKKLAKEQRRAEKERTLKALLSAGTTGATKQTMERRRSA